jgi:hypothetical protein
MWSEAIGATERIRFSSKQPEEVAMARAYRKGVTKIGDVTVNWSEFDNRSLERREASFDTAWFNEAEKSPANMLYYLDNQVIDSLRRAREVARDELVRWVNIGSALRKARTYFKRHHQVPDGVFTQWVISDPTLNMREWQVRAAYTLSESGLHLQNRIHREVGSSSLTGWAAVISAMHQSGSWNDSDIAEAATLTSESELKAFARSIRNRVEKPVATSGVQATGPMQARKEFRSWLNESARSWEAGVDATTLPLLQEAISQAAEAILKKTLGDAESTHQGEG